MLRKKKSILIGLSVILILFVLGFMQSTEAVCQNDTPTGTTVSGFFYGTATVNGEPVQIGDTIRAYVYDVDTNNGCIGIYVVDDPGTAGDYGSMSVYGNDATGSDPKNGAAVGDTIHFVLCRDGYEYDFDQTDTWSAAYDKEFVELNLTCSSCCTNFYRDQDGDGYGGDSSDYLCLVAPDPNGPDPKYTAPVAGDCDDSDEFIYDGTACNDNDPCTYDDICSGGVCAGTAYSCDDSNPCTDDTCLGDSNCSYAFNTASCNDNDPCTYDDICSGGNCAGISYSCDDGDPATEDTCLGDSNCSHVYLSGPCNDNDPCTYNDTWSNGVCEGTSYSCDDQDPCTDDICLGDSNCSYAFNTASCNDNDPCTYDDICSGGNCAGTAYSCDDQDPCTDDTCLGDSNCSYAYNTAQCDDGDACTENDVCSGGVCVGGSEVDCDDGDVCNGTETCDPNSGCQPGTDLVCEDNNDCTEDLCDPNTGCYYLPYFENYFYATGQEYDGNSQIVNVRFGLDYGPGNATYASDNWSQDNIVALHLIDPNAVEADPNNIALADLMTVDVRPSESIGQSVAWYIVVDNAAVDPNGAGYYPLLGWDLSEFICAELDGNPCVYALISGLGSSGAVLVDDMTDTNSYQTVSQDGDPNQYFTILMTCEPEPEPEPVRRPTGNIFPWPGLHPGGLGWGLPFSLGFPGGLPTSLTSGYAPGLSIPSFPGTYPGFTYPGSLTSWTSYAWTSFVPRFPVRFPTLGIYSPVGVGWPHNYWSGFPRPFSYRTGWFYTYY